MAYPVPQTAGIAGVVSFTSPGNTISTNQSSGYVEAEVNTSIVTSDNLDVTTTSTSVNIDLTPDSTMNNPYMTNLVYDTSGNTFGNIEYNPLYVGPITGTALDIRPVDKGRIVILTGTTTQEFTATTLTGADNGCWILVRNGNTHTVSGRDFSISGVVGDTVIHGGSNLQNGQSLYIVWDGTQLKTY